MPAPAFPQRIPWLNGLVLAGTIALGGRLVQLQVLQGPHLAALAREQRTKEVDLAAVRGEIVDRGGHELAISVDAYAVYAQPREFDQPVPALAAALAPVLHEPSEDVAKRLQGPQWRWLARAQDPGVAKAVNALRLAGIGTLRESKRVYPNGDFAATLIGFVGVDNHGLAGLEHDFDGVLRGTPRKLQVEVDAYGHELLREAGASPLQVAQTDGARIVLTLDEDVQHIAERELAATMDKEKALRGAVLVLDPRTGDVLALATSPSYDPNHYAGVPWSRINDWPATDAYEPGSTMKIFTAAAALEAGVVTPTEQFLCPPSIRIGGHVIEDHEATSSRELDLAGILQVSSNVGASKVGMRLAPAQHLAFLRRMGFGSPTGSGIGGESPGLVPKLPWSPLTHATVCFGQGIAVTPMQIVSAACAIADDGAWHPPRLIDRVVGPNGRVLESFPVPPARQAMSPEGARRVRELLRDVVAKGGTGAEGRIPGYNIAGKTGTAQRVSAGGGYGHDVISSFIGFIPADHPQLVVMTLLDSPQVDHFAAVTAVPLFRRVAQATLRHLGVEPDPRLLPSPAPALVAGVLGPSDLSAGPR